MKAVLAILALATPAFADWSTSASLWTSTPAALRTGLAVGAQGHAERRFGPLFAAVHAGYALASEANDVWVFDVHQGIVAAGVGAATSAGVGRVWGEVGGGALVIYQVLTRHQIERLEADGVPGTRSNWWLAPLLQAQAGIDLRFYGPWTVGLAGGPFVTRVQLDGAARVRTGWSGHIGVGRAF